MSATMDRGQPRAALFATVLSDLPNLGEAELSIENADSITHAVVGALKARQYTGPETTKIVKALIGWSGRGPTGDRKENEDFGRALYESWSKKNDITLGWPYIKSLVADAKLAYLLTAIDDPDQRPLVKVVNGKESQIVTLAEQIMIDSGLDVYQRGGALVKPGTHEVAASGGRTVEVTSFYKLGTYAIKDHMGRAALWAKMDVRAGKFLSIDPPKGFAEILLSRESEWHFPTIAGIIMSPTLRPDGSVLSAYGYDKETRLFQGARDITLLPTVLTATRADAEEALEVLKELMSEFPFVSDVDRAVALSSMVTAVARASMDMVPLHAFRASTAGSGKSYWADVVAAACLGHVCPAASTGTDLKEFEACLNGMLLSGISLFSLDNVNGDLGGDLLCRALTQRSLLLRALSSSEMHTVETMATILANGNDITVIGDAIRRVLMANLDPEMERPELRTFEHRPFEMVIANRSKYISACLTIVRAYIIAGRPNCQTPKLGSFESWNDNVRSALVWLGCADPIKSLDEARENDTDLSDLREVMTRWPASTREDHGNTVARLIEVAGARGPENTSFEKPLLNPEWNQCLVRVAGKAGGIDATALGKWLASKASRVVSKQRIVKLKGKAQGDAKLWMLETVGTPDGGVVG